ncbi:MAG TPA: hypothetical protein VKY89_15230 [Thermoanaerobaculia bacterium]|jgi:hypothetical protein|nr:hypothetical protein [Thermoanaerobaculia bacterium]
MSGWSEGSFENEYPGEMEAGELEGGYGYGFGARQGAGPGRPFSEEQELELATELLTISHDQELEQFLGDIFKKVGQVAGKVMQSPVGKALGPILKKVAKTALPIVGGALGTFVGGPAGSALGSKLGSAASNLLGLELEGLSGEDRELEVAQRVVRLAADAAQQAAQAPPGAPAQQVARAALAAAAARHAPGLLRNGIGAAPGTHDGPHADPVGHPGRAQQGRWVRRGNQIVVLGL